MGWLRGGGVNGWGGAITFNSVALACMKNSTLLNVNFISMQVLCYFNLNSCHIRNAMLNQTHSCNIDVATLFGVNLISNKMSCYLKLSSCNIHDTTPFNVNINSNKMLCCLKFISCNKNDAALLNINFISYQMSLVRQLETYFFKKKCPENHNSNGPK